jgi:hypothetical protein
MRPLLQYCTAWPLPRSSKTSSAGTRSRRRYDSRFEFVGAAVAIAIGAERSHPRRRGRRLVRPRTSGATVPRRPLRRAGCHRGSSDGRDWFGRSIGRCLCVLGVHEPSGGRPLAPSIRMTCVGPSGASQKVGRVTSWMTCALLAITSLRSSARFDPASTSSGRSWLVGTGSRAARGRWLVRWTDPARVRWELSEQGPTLLRSEPRRLRTWQWQLWRPKRDW